MEQQPIIITGFGRSGTTWLSDIISKVLGGFIFFEPFHPSVCEKARDICYESNTDIRDLVLEHARYIMTVPPKDPWLLRNHLVEPIQDTHPSFIKYLLDHTKPLGFKTIRCNHIQGLFTTDLKAHLIYIHRHPLSVLSSVKNRKNFWNEFGWTWHKKEFEFRTLTRENFNEKELVYLREIKKTISSNEQHILFMWSISFLLSISQLNSFGGLRVSYEDLYIKPYDQTRALLSFLQKDHLDIHPAHLFTPSLTTLKTIHNQRRSSRFTRDDLDQIFWKTSFSRGDAQTWNRLLSNLLLINKQAYNIAVHERYIES